MQFLSDEMQSFTSSNYDTLKEIISGIRNYYTQLPEVSQTESHKISVPCYRGTLCQTEEYVSGVVFSMQVLGSMNITEKDLDQLEVKDPDLYNNLMSQYYHILKKYTSSGALDEKVIYKP